LTSAFLAVLGDCDAVLGMIHALKEVFYIFQALHRSHGDLLLAARGNHTLLLLLLSEVALERFARHH